MQSPELKPNYALLDWPRTRKELKLTPTQDAAVVAAWKQVENKIAAEKAKLNPLQRERKRTRYASSLLAPILTTPQKKRLNGMTLMRQGPTALWFLSGLGALTLTTSQSVQLYQAWARLDAEQEKQRLAYAKATFPQAKSKEWDSHKLSNQQAEALLQWIGSQSLQLETKKWRAAGAILTTTQRQQLVALFGENPF